MFKNLANIRITASVVNDVGDFITHIGNAYTNASPEDKEKIADGMQAIYNSIGRVGMMACMEFKALESKLDNLDCPSMVQYFDDNKLDEHPLVKFSNSLFEEKD